MPHGLVFSSGEHAASKSCAGGIDTESYGWRVREGAEDSGAERASGAPLFDYWFDVEGVTNVIETYLEARAVAGPPLNNKTGQIAVAEIEQEMGGTLESRTQTYLDHSVVTELPAC